MQQRASLCAHLSCFSSQFPESVSQPFLFFEIGTVTFLCDTWKGRPRLSKTRRKVAKTWSDFVSALQNFYKFTLRCQFGGFLFRGGLFFQARSGKGQRQSRGRAICAVNRGIPCDTSYGLNDVSRVEVPLIHVICHHTLFHTFVALFWCNPADLSNRVLSSV